MQPGVYIGGISTSSQPNITFAPGIYYLQGRGLTMSGSSSSLTALSVIIYNGGGKVVQSPPTSGAYYGMSIFQDRSSTQTLTLSGVSGWNFTGTVYAAKAHMDVSGGSSATIGSQFVADTMTLSGSSTFNDIDPDKGYRPRDIRLIE